MNRKNSRINRNSRIKPILVCYLNMVNMDNNYIDSVYNKIKDTSYKIFVIPTFKSETKIECIYPINIFNRRVEKSIEEQLNNAIDNLNKYLLVHHV